MPRGRRLRQQDVAAPLIQGESRRDEQQRHDEYRDQESASTHWTGALLARHAAGKVGRVAVAAGELGDEQVAGKGVPPRTAARRGDVTAPPHSFAATPSPSRSNVSVAVVAQSSVESSSLVTTPLSSMVSCSRCPGP